MVKCIQVEVTLITHSTSNKLNASSKEAKRNMISKAER